MPTEMEDLKRKFNKLCHEIGGTSELDESRNEEFYSYLRCYSAKRFPDPKEFIDLMKEASDLSEKIPDGATITLSFFVQKSILGRIFETHISGRAGYYPEEWGIRRYIIHLGRRAPYEYVGIMPELNKELNDLLERELGREKGWKHYECHYRVESVPSSPVLLNCTLAYSEWEKPDLDRILGIVEKFKEVSEAKPKPFEMISGRISLVE